MANTAIMPSLGISALDSMMGAIAHLASLPGLELAQVPGNEPGDLAANLTLLQAIVLGIVQGLTEFLPISSTAHLKAVPVALGWGDPGVSFTAVIQLGSIAAILWYFWQDLVQVISGMLTAMRKRDYQARDFRIGLGIGLGTIPILVCGLMIKVFIPDFDRSPLRSMASIAIASIVMALLLALAEYIGTRKRQYDDLGTKDGIWMGLAQTLALVPGVSRSGSTLTAGLFIGLERAAAARFSFLLGIPAITIAGLVELPELFKLGQGIPGITLGDLVKSPELMLQVIQNATSFLPIIAGLIASVASSYAAIAWLLRYLQTHNTWIFVWYRLGFGVAILGAIAFGTVQNI